MWHYWIRTNPPCPLPDNDQVVSLLTHWMRMTQLNHFAREQKSETALKESGGSVARRQQKSVQQAEQQMCALTSPRLKCPGQPHTAHKASTHNTVLASPGSPSVMDLHKLRNTCLLPAAESASLSSSRRWSPTLAPASFREDGLLSALMMTLS